MKTVLQRLTNPPSWLLHGIRFLVAAIFLVAGLLKWLEPLDFAKAIDSFQLLPPAGVGIGAIVLPPLEILAGGLWLLNRFSRTSAVAILWLCLIFIGALVSAMASGVSAECGCFGGLFLSSSSLAHAVVRSVFLALATAYWLSCPPPVGLNGQKSKADARLN